MLNLHFITNKPAIATFAEEAGVDTIFIDMEVMGKHNRQGHINTVQNHHEIADIAAVRRDLKTAKLLVRTNPLHDNSRTEIDQAIDAGAQVLMLPMFANADDLQRYCAMVDGRVPVCPLIETPSALADCERLAKVEGLGYVYFGLNDLQLALKSPFIFALLAQGFLDQAIAAFRAAGLTYGIGGLARLDNGLVPGRLVLGEYKRLRASAVILSRAFHTDAHSLEELNAKIDLKHEIALLRAQEQRLEGRSAEQIETDHDVFRQSVDAAVANITASNVSQ